MLAGGALAPGALIVIDGIRFSPSDVAIEIETGGKSYPAAVVSADAEHILARMPDFKQAGRARLFVVSHGQRSAGSDINLTTSAFGIFTANGEGWGPAGAVHQAGQSPAALQLLRPGQEMTISGTGFGTGGPVQVLVGDLPAAHLRRTSANGVDQLTFRIPQEVPVGCAVPVVVTTGSASSNTATLQIGAGATCGSARNWFDDLRAPGRTSANLVLLRSDVILELTPGKPVRFALDNFIGGFAHHLEGKPTGPFDLLPAPGACVNWAGSLDSNQLALPSLLGENLDDPGPEIGNHASGIEDLDAGPSMTVTGPEGARKAARARNRPRTYSAVLGGNPPVTRIKPTPLFLAPGQYRIESPGGEHVSAVDINVDVGPVIEWRNRDHVTTLDRHSGVDLEWTLPLGYTAIAFAWNVSRRNSFGGFAVCLPPIGATRYRIPAAYVANLPATVISASDLSLGFVGVAAVPLDPPSFEVKGIERGRAVFASLSGRSVIVQ